MSTVDHTGTHFDYCRDLNIAPFEHFKFVHATECRTCRTYKAGFEAGYKLGLDAGYDAGYDDGALDG